MVLISGSWIFTKFLVLLKAINIGRIIPGNNVTLLWTLVPIKKKCYSIVDSQYHSDDYRILDPSCICFKRYIFFFSF